MEIKILNSVLYRELMPWVFDTENTKSIHEKIKRIGSKQSLTADDLVSSILVLIEDYPGLVKWLSSQSFKGKMPLKSHSYTMEFPEYFDATTKFFFQLISLETLRVYNAFDAIIQKYDERIDINYHTVTALRNIKSLAINTVKEIEDRGFEEMPESLSYFVLTLLWKQLTVLFFEIQDLGKNNLKNITSVEDYFLIDLDLPKNYVDELSRADILIDNNKKEVKEEKLSFGFKGDKKELKSVVDQLTIQADFLNEDKCSTDDLIEILTAKSLKTNMHKIYFGCETVQLSYIVNRLKPFFNKPIPITIEKSKLFYTKNNRLLKAQNLYSNKIDNPKKQPIIDKILKQMQ